MVESDSSSDGFGPRTSTLAWTRKLRQVTTPITARISNISRSVSSGNLATSSGQRTTLVNGSLCDRAVDMAVEAFQRTPITHAYERFGLSQTLTFPFKSPLEHVPADPSYLIVPNIPVPAQETLRLTQGRLIPGIVRRVDILAATTDWEASPSSGILAYNH